MNCYPSDTYPSTDYYPNSRRIPTGLSLEALAGLSDDSTRPEAGDGARDRRRMESYEAFRTAHYEERRRPPEYMSACRALVNWARTTTDHHSGREAARELLATGDRIARFRGLSDENLAHFKWFVDALHGSYLATERACKCDRPTCEQCRETWMAYEAQMDPDGVDLWVAVDDLAHDGPHDDDILRPTSVDQDPDLPGSSDE